MTNKIIKGGKYAYKGVKMTGKFLCYNIAKPLCLKVIQGVGHFCKVIEDNLGSKENKENNPKPKTEEKNPKPKAEENNPELKTEENEENKSLFSSTDYPHYDSLLLKNNDNNNIGNNVIGYLPYDNNFNINNNFQMQNNYQGQNAPLPEYYNKFGNNNNIYKKPDYFIPDN